MQQGTFIRSKRIYCGKTYMAASAYNYSGQRGKAAVKKRAKKQNVSAPKQKALNDKNARRYFEQLCNTNFGAEDQIIHLTYGPGNVPESKEIAEKMATNYLRKVRRVRAKKGLTPLRYILVTEGGDLSKKTGKMTKIHHHVIVNGGLERDELELLWNTKPVKLDKAATDPEYRAQLERSRIGYANSRRLQPGENGLQSLANYLTKDPKGKKRWKGSMNLEKPVQVCNDHKYSMRELDRVCRNGDVYNREWWEKQYPGYTLAGSPDNAVEVTPPDDLNSWSVYARLRKKVGG